MDIPISALLKAIHNDIVTNGQYVFNAGAQSIATFLDRLGNLTKVTTPWTLQITDPSASDCFVSGDIKCQTYRRTQQESARLGIVRLLGPLLGDGDRNIMGVAKYVAQVQLRKHVNIVVLCGAGISTSCGIPDFRSPGTGVYDNLSEYNLPNPQAIFSADYFAINPVPFFKFHAKLLEHTLKPSPTHIALSALCESGMVTRIYTQNIDSLELDAGISESLCVQVHGTSERAHCNSCKRDCDIALVRDAVRNGAIPMCPSCTVGVVRPNIVMFGEPVSERYVDGVDADLSDCDLLLVLGTSLSVPPISQMHQQCPHDTLRVFVNLTPAPEGLGFDFASDSDRDLFIQSTTDEAVPALVNAILKKK
jgi:NAD-dependent deacetylase sirtuin 2